MSDHSSYILRETIVNTAINTALGMAVFVVLFKEEEAIALWGVRGLIMDCLLQGFMVGLMSVLPPGVLTRLKIGKGNIPGNNEPLGALLLRAVKWGLISMVGLTGLAILLAYLSGAASIGFFPGLTLKALASVVIVSVITPIALRFLLAKAVA